MKALYIPCDVTEPITLIEVAGYAEMAKAIGRPCRYIERVRTRLTQPHLGNLVLVVDEDGLFHDWPDNPRANLLYSNGMGMIKGPALMLREAWGADGLDFAPVQDGDVAVVASDLNVTYH